MASQHEDVPPDPEDLLNRVERLRPFAGDLVQDQHIVSQVLLKQFTVNDGPSGYRLQDLSLKYPNATPKRRSPRECAKVTHFVKYASRSLEMVWKAVKDRLGAAIIEMHSEDPFNDPAAVLLIKDAIALHYCRSHLVGRVSDIARDKTTRDTRKSLFKTPGLLTDFYFQRTGLLLEGATGLTRAADLLMAKITEDFRNDGLLRVRIEGIFNAARDFLRRMGLEILRSTSGEFLIGDAPALTIRSDSAAVGPLEGVPLGKANSVFMPLSPTICAAIGPKNLVGKVPQSAVDRLNRIQVKAAAEHVFFRPDSGLDKFARCILAE